MGISFGEFWFFDFLKKYGDFRAKPSFHGNMSATKMAQITIQNQKIKILKNSFPPKYYKEHAVKIVDIYE